MTVPFSFFTFSLSFLSSASSDGDAEEEKTGTEIF